MFFPAFEGTCGQKTDSNVKDLIFSLLGSFMLETENWDPQCKEYARAL